MNTAIRSLNGKSSLAPYPFVGSLVGLSLSLQALFKALTGIQEVANVYPATGKPGSPGRPRVQTTLTEMDPAQQALYRLIDLDRYRKSRV